MAEPERGDRLAALLRFVDADVSPVTTQTPARSWSSNTPGPSEDQHRGLVERACCNTRGRARAVQVRPRPRCVADAVTYVVTRPRRIAVNEVVIRPTEQQE